MAVTSARKAMPLTEKAPSAAGPDAGEPAGTYVLNRVSTGRASRSSLSAGEDARNLGKGCGMERLKDNQDKRPGSVDVRCPSGRCGLFVAGDGVRIRVRIRGGSGKGTRHAGTAGSGPRSAAAPRKRRSYEFCSREGTGLLQGESGPEQAVMNMPLVAGVRIEAGSDGQAEVEFNDGSVARLTPNSSLELKR